MVVRLTSGCTIAALPYDDTRYSYSIELKGREITPGAMIAHCDFLSLATHVLVSINPHERSEHLAQTQ